MLKNALLIVVSIFLAGTVGAETIVNYPNLDGLGENGIGYQVLKLALKKAGGEFAVKQGIQAVNQEDALKMLSQGQIDVLDTGASANYAKEFDVAYRPIDRGVLGWRLFIINKDNADSFAKVSKLDDLKHFTAAQGTGWPDVAVLQAAGLKVKTAPDIPGVMDLISKKQADFFPLGANEVFGLLNKFGQGSPALMVDTKLVLVYPFGRLFYVKKGNTKLLEQIEKGMDAALADGSLQKILYLHPSFSDAFSKANLKSRLSVKISNPQLPDGFNKIDPKWWFDPSK